MGHQKLRCRICQGCLILPVEPLNSQGDRLVSRKGLRCFVGRHLNGKGAVNAGSPEEAKHTGIACFAQLLCSLDALSRWCAGVFKRKGVPQKALHMTPLFLQL
ncbi:MAG: hypothetical protein VXW79_07355, partial [Bacteroidota bacterium]|nr:hypothetical protein [Bacteroidota bacterium]